MKIGVREGDNVHFGKKQGTGKTEKTHREKENLLSSPEPGSPGKKTIFKTGKIRCLFCDAILLLRSSIRMLQ